MGNSSSNYKSDSSYRKESLRILDEENFKEQLLVNRKKSIFYNPSAWKKLLQVKRTKNKKNAKQSSYKKFSNNKADFNHPGRENPKTEKPPVVSRTVVFEASTDELLCCLGNFVCTRCANVPRLSPTKIVAWIKRPDEQLHEQGWHRASFLQPATAVFLFMVAKEAIAADCAATEEEVRHRLMACLYVSCAVAGAEISYPLRPFIRHGRTDRAAFWDLCCDLVDRMSGRMLEISRDRKYFAALFKQLRAFDPVVVTTRLS